MKLRRHRIVWAAAALVLLVPLVVLLLWPDDSENLVTRVPDPPVSPPEQTLLPLLGLPGQVPDRPALAVKIENTDRGRPQTGLVQADIVMEEVVEGGLTRLMAVFHSQDPDTVGPVRSARSTDISLLAELDRPLFAWSGANPTFAAAVRNADIVDVGFAAVPDAYRRDDARRAPYDLYASPVDLRAAGVESDPGLGPPPALFAYRAPGAGVDAPDAEPIGGYTTATGGTTGLATTIRWDWDARSATWLRTQDGSPHVDDQGARVSAVNVVIRFTDYRDTGIRDSIGAVVPEAVTVGDGDAWLLSDGRVQRGRWHKQGPDAPTTYTDLEGTPLRLTPGPTWVELLPPGTGDVVAAAG
jgi:hypothetical protein